MIEFKFKMEMVSSILRSIMEGDARFSVDLKGSYFQISIHYFVTMQYANENGIRLV